MVTYASSHSITGLLKKYYLLASRTNESLEKSLSFLLRSGLLTYILML